MKKHLVPVLFLIVALCAALSFGLYYHSLPKPNIYFGENFWKSGNEITKENRVKQRFAQNWNYILYEPTLRRAFKGKVVTEAGYIGEITGNYIYDLSMNVPVVLRFTSSSCFGQVLQKKYEIFERLAKTVPDHAFIDVYEDDQVLDSDTIKFMVNLRNETAARLSATQLEDFDKYWGLMEYDSNSLHWHRLSFAGDVITQERSKQIALAKEVSESGMLWKFVPTTPQIVLIDHGKVVKFPEGYALLSGTPKIVTGNLPNFEGFVAAFLAEKDKAKRKAMIAAPLTPEQDKDAAAITASVRRYFHLPE